MKDMLGRENQIFDILEKFMNRDLEFVLVGGYAISAFSHRFSVDADLVIEEKKLESFTEFLEDDGFKEIQSEDLGTIYGGKFLAYEKGKDFPVTVDLLVNSLECRQTRASWSYEYLRENSSPSEVEGSERSVEVVIPEKELLIAIKLHSGRLTDVRDVVAIGPKVEFEKLKKHADRGNREKFSEVLEKSVDTIESERFEDSFKGVFSEKRLAEENIALVKKLIKDLIENL